MPYVKCSYCSREKVSSEMYWCSNCEIWICSSHISSGPRCPRCSHTVPGRESSGGCFLTTACVEYAGLQDDCRYLQTMRKFRDDYIKVIPGGDELLNEYQKLAPKIVEHINNSQESNEVLDDLLASINKTVELIELGNNEEALNLCLRKFQSLKVKYNIEA